MPSASLTSFLFDFTYGATNCGFIRTAPWPRRAARRAQWWAPPQASIATVHPGGSSARYDCRPARRSRLRSTTAPAASTAVTWNTFFARSIPTRDTLSMVRSVVD